jgi:uracil phosphoribosyltransferase
MQKPKKVNVSINPETMDLLTKLRETLTEKMGFTPSYSQVIQYLAREGERNEKGRA